MKRHAARAFLLSMGAVLSTLAVWLWYAHGRSPESGAQITADHVGSLTIYSTTDAAAFRPVIEDFRTLYRHIDVQYVELDAGALHRLYLAEHASAQSKADLLLSSAMDLQVKLVNDGYAATHVSAQLADWPSWAKWRNQAFGITFEPAVMVFNKALLEGRPLPKSRPELLDALRSDPEFWRHRIGAYDIERSSVGYLLAAEDARQDSEFGSLLARFGEAGLRTFDTAARLLEALERGELALGYNLLGSYARARIEEGAPLAVVYPQDYTLAVSRTVLLPRDAPHAAEAHAFLEYLLSLRGQRTLSTQSRLSAVHPGIAGPDSQFGIAERKLGPLRPISLGPGLLTYQDQERIRKLLASWRRALENPPSPAPPR